MCMDENEVCSWAYISSILSGYMDVSIRDSSYGLGNTFGKQEKHCKKILIIMAEGKKILQLKWGF